MAKEVLELAVLKAQTSLPLSDDEIIELLDVDTGLLMTEHGLDLIQAEHVMMWRKSEALRLQARITSTPMSQRRRVEESRRRLKRNKPITITQLRRIIREELEQGGGYPGDGEEPVLSPDELELYEDDMNEVLETIAVIGAGVALGIAGLWGGVKLAGAARSILGNMLDAAQRAAENKLAQLKGDLRRDVQTELMSILQGDAKLDQLAKEYQDLTHQVKTKPKRAATKGGAPRGGIKGLRGDEYTITRKAQKAKAKELADYLEIALSDAWLDIDPKLTQRASKQLSGGELGRTQDVVRSYGRRDRSQDQ